MKQLQNTLYLTSHNAYLAREGECLVVEIPDRKPVRLPSHNFEAVVQFGYPGASPAALALCMQQNISVSFLTPSGRFLARVEGPQTGNVLLRRTQYRVSDDPSGSTRIASRCITAKILNCRTLLMRGMRDHAGASDTDTAKACRRMKDLAHQAFQQENLEILRGIEGEAATLYFSQINKMLVTDAEGFQMQCRSRRPPLDRFNCLLSFFYSLLTHECRSACETTGLDPQVGFLHRDRPGRPSLALDIMEELRGPVADRMVLTLINRKQVQEKDFDIIPNGAVLMKDDARKTVIDAWQKRKQDTITHPFLQEKIAFGLLPYVQALLLSRYLRGDLDDYPAFIWR